MDLHTMIMNETKDEKPWINRNIINFSWKKFCGRRKTSKISAPVTKDYGSLNILPSKGKGGRPKGCTILLYHHLKESAIAAKNEITSMHHEKRREYIKKGEKNS